MSDREKIAAKRSELEVTLAEWATREISPNTPLYLHFGMFSESPVCIQRGSLREETPLEQFFTKEHFPGVSQGVLTRIRTVTIGAPYETFEHSKKGTLRTVGDLLTARYSVLAIPGFGRKIFRRVSDALAAEGFTL